MSANVQWDRYQVPVTFGLRHVAARSLTPCLIMPCPPAGARPAWRCGDAPPGRRKPRPQPHPRRRGARRARLRRFSGKEEAGVAVPGAAPRDSPGAARIVRPDRCATPATAGRGDPGLSPRGWSNRRFAPTRLRKGAGGTGGAGLAWQGVTPGSDPAVTFPCGCSGASVRFARKPACSPKRRAALLEWVPMHSANEGSAAWTSASSGNSRRATAWR